MVPRINKKKKKRVSNYVEDAPRKVPKIIVDNSGSKPLTDEVAEDSTSLSIVTQSEGGTLLQIFDLTGRPTGRLSHGHRPHGKDSVTRGPGSIEEESNKFSPTKGKIVFTLMFEDVNKKRVLVTHKRFRHNIVSTYLVSNVTLPQNHIRMSKLNQFIGSVKYKVNKYIYSLMFLR